MFLGIDSLSVFDLLKIGASIAGIVLLWHYKREIAKLIGGLLIGDQYSKIKEKSDKDIMKEIETRMNDIQKMGGN